MENGSKDSKSSEPIAATTSAEENTFVLGATLQHMKKMTGKESFTLAEMQDPRGTIEYYKKDNGTKDK